MSGPTLKAALEAAIQDDRVVSIDEWGSLSPLFEQTAKERPAEVDPALEKFVSRAEVFAPSIWREVKGTAARLNYRGERLDLLQLIAPAQQLVAGLLLMQAKSAGGLTLEKFRRIYGVTLAEVEGGESLAEVWPVYGATPVNLFFFLLKEELNRGVKAWVDPQIFDLMDDPTKDHPKELVKFGVSASLVETVRKLPMTPPAGPSGSQPKRRHREDSVNTGERE